jgi:hypothetical protein
MPKRVPVCRYWHAAQSSPKAVVLILSRLFFYTTCEAKSFANIFIHDRLEIGRMVFSQSTYIERSLAMTKSSDFIARKMIDAHHTYLFPQPVNLRLLFLLVIFP